VTDARGATMVRPKGIGRHIAQGREMTTTAAVELGGLENQQQPETVPQAGAPVLVAVESAPAVRPRKHLQDVFFVSLIVSVQGAWLAALAYGAWLLLF
jgi:hypothetical protein